MKEIIEFRINNEFAHLILKPGEGKNNGFNTIVKITRDEPKFDRIRFLSKEIKEKTNGFLFLYSNIKREYTKKELDSANLLQILIKSTFEPAGDECGTQYDEHVACEICGANRKQIGDLKLKRNSIPKKDIARTIAGEVVVSEAFVIAFTNRKLKGATFEPVLFGKAHSTYFQLCPTTALELTENTIAGVNLFDSSTGSEPGVITVPNGQCIQFEREIYKCPKGHTIGLNLLSEAFVFGTGQINNFDIYVSKQKIGVKRGLLRPQPLFLCSPSLRKMVLEEKLTGFEFEVAHIE